MSFYMPKLKLAMQRASEEFGRKINLEDLRDPSKHRCLMEPRWFCMGYMHMTGNYSLSKLGEMFKRHHSTILHGLRKAHGHDGKLAHKESALWTKEHFENLLFLDGLMRLPPQPIERVNFEQLLAIGARNLALAISDLPRVQERRAA